MRITRENLLSLARDVAAQRARRSRGLVCVLLTGSLLSDPNLPLLGGTADVDLVLIHNSEPGAEREIVAVSDEVHLDLAHYSQSPFAMPRRLRTDPWLGWLVCGAPQVLYDQGHWFDYVQASACAGFGQPENVLRRARPLAEQARAGWMELHAAVGDGEAAPPEVMLYLNVLRSAGNALALTAGGPPLPMRRFFLNLPERARALGRPGLASGLADLIAPAGTTIALDEWKDAWLASLRAAAAQENGPADLAPARHPYFERAARALAGENPAAAAWIVLRTWTQALCAAPGLADHRPAWESAASALGLRDLSARLPALDAYLDSVEEVLDDYARKQGIE